MLYYSTSDYSLYVRAPDMETQNGFCWIKPYEPFFVLSMKIRTRNVLHVELLTLDGHVGWFGILEENLKQC